MNNSINFFLRGLDVDGREYFYTGRAGECWLSPERADAFTWGTLEAARNRAKQFNGRVALHGVWFLALEEVHRG